MGLDCHAFLVKEKVDKRLAGIGPRSLRPKADVLSVAEHGEITDVIELRATLVVGQHKAHERDADGGFAGADAVRSRNDRFGENRFGGG